jgi:hypothetical protein
MEIILQSIPVEYQLPLIVIVALGFPIIAMAITNRLFAQYRVANIAKRMGLTIAEGNPKLNMVNAIPIHNLKMGAGVGGNWLSRAINTTKETKVRLVGAPHGRPTEFVYFRRHEIKEGLLVVTTDSWFECRLSVQVPVAFPEFEIVRRSPALRIAGVYGIKARPELPLPPQPFGKPDLDRKLVLTTAEPRLGPALARAVGGLSPLEFVHVQGRDGALHWLATEEGSALAIRRMVEAQQVLERIADVLAGPAPTSICRPSN